MSVVVEKINNEHFKLLCSVCNKTASDIQNGIPSYWNEPCVIFTGITHSQALDLKHAKIIYSFLNTNTIRELHVFLRNKKLLDLGIDSYCPECDACYCEEHFHVNAVIDEEGFYDYTNGYCPHMHERMLDD